MAVLETHAAKISIDAPFREVARLVADPARAHEWGTEFYSGPLRRADGDEWIAPVPMMGGEIRYRHEADVERGIMDVYLAPPGSDFGPPLPMRVVPNGDGADVIVVLARMPGTSTEQWEQGLRGLDLELETLRSLAEGA
ncbi:MAG: hypothetical protein ACRDN8_04295 [Thermoleophilaceae bacterium]